MVNYSPYLIGIRHSFSNLAEVEIEVKKVLELVRKTRQKIVGLEISNYELRHPENYKSLEIQFWKELSIQLQKMGYSTVQLVPDTYSKLRDEVIRDCRTKGIDPNMEIYSMMNGLPTNSRIPELLESKTRLMIETGYKGKAGVLTGGRAHIIGAKQDLNIPTRKCFTTSTHDFQTLFRYSTIRSRTPFKPRKLNRRTNTSNRKPI